MYACHPYLAILPFIQCHANWAFQMLLDLYNKASSEIAPVAAWVLQPPITAAYHSHELAVLVCCVVQTHAAVAIVSFPEVQYIWLIDILTTFKGHHAIVAVLHPLLGELHHLQIT